MYAENMLYLFRKYKKVKEILEDFGADIMTNAIKASRLSLRQLAGKLEYSPSYLSKIKNNHAVMSIHLFKKLVDNNYISRYYNFIG